LEDRGQFIQPAKFREWREADQRIVLGQKAARAHTSADELSAAGFAFSAAWDRFLIET